MKTASILRLALSVFLILHPSAFLLAQGPLTPPGAPAPTMKTLDQLEARTPIGTAPFTISASGSYYLTGNISVGTSAANAITINADNVTLDLNGFTISSTHPTGSSAGIALTGVRKNVQMRNGIIRGTTVYSSPNFTGGGFLSGISCPAGVRNVRISGVTVEGVRDDGIAAQASNNTSIVESCHAHTCPGNGITAGIVRGSTVAGVGTIGIQAVSVSDCVAVSVGTASSTHAINADTVLNSRGSASGGTGITANVAENSFGDSLTYYGINAGSAAGCRGTSIGGTGLLASAATNSRGSSTGGIGLSAAVATNCTGSSTNGTGLISNNATGCLGTTGAGLVGLDADPGAASYCRGSNSTGGTALIAGTAIGCTVGIGTVSSLNKFLGTP
jgi:hypothetical protein